jgi:hypothetical protein
MEERTIRSLLARVGLALVVAGLLSLVVVSGARAALYLVLTPDAGAAGQVILGRTGGDGAFPSVSDSLPAYLVNEARADGVRESDDAGLTAIGALEVDQEGNGTLSFVIPDLEPGPYVVILDCAGCAEFSSGRVMVPVADLLITAAPDAAAFACPVTLPNGSPFPPGGGSFSFAGGAPPPGWVPPTYGNGRLWVGYLPQHGVAMVRDDLVGSDGSIDMKFPWARRIVEYRDVGGALTGIFAGELEIDTRRLDASAPPARVETNPQGVHVGSGITFPTAGCWEITGTAGEDSLSFVILVLVDGQPLPITSMDPPAPPFIPLGILLLTVAALLGAARMLRSGSRGIVASMH